MISHKSHKLSEKPWKLANHFGLWALGQGVALAREKLTGSIDGVGQF